MSNMHFIKKEDMPAILPIIKSRSSPLRQHLLQLQGGEALLMPLAMWKAKSTPDHIITKLKKEGLLYEYGRSVDGTGWLFRRIA